MSARRFHHFALAAGVGALLLSGCSASVSVGTADSTEASASAPAGEPVETLAFDAAALAAEIEASVGKPVTVDCPADIPLQQGLVTECTVTDGTYTNELTITQDDAEGNVTWLIGDVLSGPTDDDAGATESAAPSAAASGDASGAMAPVTTQADFEGLFLTDDEVDALLPGKKMGPQWADGAQGPTAWKRGNRVLPARCQVFEDFGNVGAGTVPDGPMAWIGGKGWTSAKTNENGFGDSFMETVAVYQDEATARAEYDQMAALAEDCATYRFPDRTDIKRHRMDSVDVSADPPMIAWSVNSPDDGKVAWIGTAVWLGDRVAYVEILRMFRDDETLIDAYPSLVEAALTRAAGMAG